MKKLFRIFNAMILAIILVFAGFSSVFAVLPTTPPNSTVDWCGLCPNGGMYNPTTKSCDPCKADAGGGATYDPNTCTCVCGNSNYVYVPGSKLGCVPSVEWCQFDCINWDGVWDPVTHSCSGTTKCYGEDQYYDKKTCECACEKGVFNPTTRQCEPDPELCNGKCTAPDVWNDDTQRCEPCVSVPGVSYYDPRSCQCRCTQEGYEYDAATGTCVSESSDGSIDWCDYNCKPGEMWNPNINQCEQCKTGYNSDTCTCQCEWWQEYIPGVGCKNSWAWCEFDCKQYNGTWNPVTHSCSGSDKCYGNGQYYDNETCECACMDGVYNPTTHQCDHEQSFCDAPCQAPNVWNEDTDSCEQCLTIPGVSYYDPGSCQCRCVQEGYQYQFDKKNNTAECVPDGGGSGQTCQAGYYWEPVKQMCQPCDQGYYNDTPGAASCTMCPGGWTTSGLGATTCDQICDNADHVASWFATGVCQISTCQSGYTKSNNTCVLPQSVISFNANGGTGGQSANVIATYGAAMPTISTTAPTRTGYTFTGWYDAASGGMRYYNGDGTSARNWDKTTDATLYAHWTENVAAAEFSLTTTSLAANTVFSFQMSAQGTFMVDWGDGTSETITRTNTTNTTYSHTYTTAGTYTIGMSGQATGYGTGTAISFMNNTKIAGISGSLGAIFGTLSSGTNRQPRFNGTFAGCGNLTGSIPSGLFSGISGQPAAAMFAATFEGCSNLSGSIPSGLFSGISGATGAPEVFLHTFSECSGLTGSIPGGLFSGISGEPSPDMFSGTFIGCTGLTGFVPHDLFAGLTSTNYSSGPMVTVFERTGLATACPAGYYRYDTGFEVDFDDKVACAPCPNGYTSDEDSHEIAQCYTSCTVACSGTAACPANAASCSYNAEGNVQSGTLYYGGTCSATPGLCPLIDFTCNTGYTKSGNSCVANTYTISYTLNGGTNYSGAPTSYNVATPTITLGTPTLTGYTFGGWYTSSTFSGSAVTSIPQGSTGDKTLYAKWTPNTYTVTLDNQGATTAGTTVYYYQYKTVNPCYYYTSSTSFEQSTCLGSNGYTITKPTRTGYTFGGYYTGTNGTGTQYVDANGGAVNNLYSAVAGNTTLYAKWTEVEFSITTTSLAAGTVFSFTMSAQGDFVIDWGDGNIQQITRTNTTNARYSHTYTTAGTYTIGMAGQATGYNTNTSIAAIGFADNKNIAGISGSLGAIFGTLSSGTNRQPRFHSTFYNCSNLTSSIPSGLFSGVSGAPVDYMFYSTFRDCSGLTGSIPARLFSGVSGAPAHSMFYMTFSGCKGLTGGIPAGLFSGISGAPAIQMFRSTFDLCSGLTSIPEKLFGELDGAPANYMFYNTFGGCRGLTGSIPENLFAGIKGAPADWMFAYTFSSCIGLTGSIPEKLFGEFDGAPAGSMFASTFASCSGLTGSIPSGLFSGISGAPASGMFRATFDGCSGLTGYIPYGLFSGISGERIAGDFTYTVTNTGLAKSCPANMYQATINTTPSFNSLDGHAICAPCPSGTISPVGAIGIEQCVCPPDSYMNNSECNACPTGLVSPMGASDSGACGRMLHVGDNVMYLRSTQKTTPSLRFDFDNDGVADLFGNMSTSSKMMSSGADKSFKVNYGGQVYYIHDDSAQ